MAQYKKKGTYDYKLLNNHTREKMKRITITFLASLFLLTYIGCGSTTSETPDATPTTEPTATQAVVPTEEPTTVPEPTATNTPEPTATSTPTPEPTATSTPVPTSTPTPEPTAIPEPTQAATAEVVSDELFDFTFELDGVVYQLPMTYQTLVNSGWELHKNYDKNEKLNGYTYYSLEFVKGSESVYFDVVNMSGHATAIKDCIIGGISVSDYSEVTFSVAKGISFGVTKDTVKEAFGVPDTDSEKSMKYKKENYKTVGFGFYNDDIVCSSIEVRCFEAIGDGVTVVSEERPAYLDEYVAPTELGEDITVTVFELDGKLYQLPCPLSVFLDNGWEIASKDIASIGAGNSQLYAATVKKGDVKLDVGLANYSKKEVYIENCIVYTISFDTGCLKNAPEDFLKLPAGLRITFTAEDIKALGSEFKEYESERSISYTFEDYYYTKKVYYYISKEDVWTKIELKNTEWEY